MNGRSKSALLAGRWAVSPATLLATGQERPMPHGTHCPSSSSDQVELLKVQWKWARAKTWHTMLLPAWHGQDSIDPALQTHSASDSEPSPNVVRSAGHLRHWLCPVAFWYWPKAHRLQDDAPGSSGIRYRLSLTGLSNPGMNCYQIQLEYKCPQVELYKAS